MIAERNPTCASCGVPSTWQIVRDPEENWLWLFELGWMCPECQDRAGRLGERMVDELG